MKDGMALPLCGRKTKVSNYCSFFYLRLLQKQRLKHVNAIVIRDSLRNEVAKQRRIEEEMREKREQQRMDISKLNMLINQAEEQMVRLRKRYETAVQHRNDRGIQLIERDEEVCIFYEKVNIQGRRIYRHNLYEEDGLIPF